MDHEEFKKAREALGLSQAQLGKMLGVPGERVRRYETDPEKGRSEKVTGPIERLMTLYIEFGIRPPDWPKPGDR